MDVSSAESSAETASGDASSIVRKRNRLIRKYKTIQPSATKAEVYYSCFSFNIIHKPLAMNTPWLNPLVKPLLVVFMSKSYMLLDIILKSWLGLCSLSDNPTGCDVVVYKDRPVRTFYICVFGQTSESSDWINHGVRFIPPQVLEQITVCTEMWRKPFSCITNCMFDDWQALTIHATMPDNMDMFVNPDQRWRCLRFSRAQHRYVVQMADYTGSPCACNDIRCEGDPCIQRTSFGFVPAGLESMVIDSRMNAILDSVRQGLRACCRLEPIKIRLLASPMTSRLVPASPQSTPLDLKT